MTRPRRAWYQEPQGRRYLHEGDRNGEPAEDFAGERRELDWTCLFCLLVGVSLLAVSAAVVVVALLD